MDLDQTWTHIHDCYLKNLVRTLLGIYPQQAGGKKRFLGPTLNFDRNVCATEHDVNNRKETYQSTGTPINAPKFGELCSKNG